VDPRLVERLCLYDWPLNVRELVTLVRRLLVIHSQEAILKTTHLPSRMLRNRSGVSGKPSSQNPAHEQPPMPRDQVERDELDLARLIEELRNHAGTVSKAAAASGLSRQRAYRLIQARPDVDLGALREGNLDEGTS
jgi:transcriptional regulator with PAS, ATPase and Fis domain